MEHRCGKRSLNIELNFFFFLFSISHVSAVTLDKKGASVTWGAKDTEDFGATSDRLHLRQILLGHTAKPDEYNVVEVSMKCTNIFIFFMETIFQQIDKFNFCRLKLYPYTVQSKFQLPY